MEGRVVRWGLAAGALVGVATSLLLVWPSANAALLGAGLFVLALLVGLYFLSRVLVSEGGGSEQASLDRYARERRS